MNSNKFIKNFKSWLTQQKTEDSQIENYIGCEVFPKFNFKKIYETLDVIKGNPLNVAKCFSHEGGLVENIIDNQALIVCKKGKFYINVRDIKKS